MGLKTSKGADVFFCMFRIVVVLTFMQQKYLSSSGRRQLGSLFTNEVQKKVGS